MRIFVSSSCYDLIDLRAELDVHLRDLGLRPILSDRASSDFAEFTLQNSIAACLSNVRSADAFLCILSQRYGRSLKDAGFEDVSATHAELREARKERKPIYMYVRDRFEADYTIWKNNPGAKLSWVKSPEDGRLFELFQEHKTLTQNEQNWYWTFRDSVELKALLAQHLSAYSGRELLARWTRDGRLPILGVQCDGRQITQDRVLIKLRISVRNSRGHAFGISCDGPGVGRVELGDLGSRGYLMTEVRIPRSPIPSDHDVFLQYSTEFGADLMEQFSLRYTDESTFGTISLVKKRIVRQLPSAID